jgi:hypothetical protein
MIKETPLLIVLVCISFLGFSQEKWQLIKDQEGIRVYTRKQDNEKFKEVRAEFELNASEDQLIGLLQNISHQKDWSYGTKRTFLINKRNKDTLTYYSEVSLPWPLSNRDLVIELSFRKDTLNKILYIQAKSVPGLVPKNPGLVRVPFSLALWNVNVMPNKLLKIQYTFRTDPGGALPAWLVNFAASVGPYNSFHKLKEIIGKQSHN